jgi:alpha-beta hydrolase superfamily lysophospholipase
MPDTRETSCRNPLEKGSTMTELVHFDYRGTRGSIHAQTWGGDTSPTHVVILVHGYGEHIGRYDHVADALITNGAVVYGLDHMGHGRSDGDRAIVTDFDDVVADVDQLVDRAVSEHPELPVIMIGHSMGGLIASRYAQTHGDRLRGLVLSGPAIGRMDLIDQLLALDEIPDIPLDPEVLSRDEAVGQAYAADPLVWHGPFQRPMLEAMAKANRQIDASGSVGDLPLLWVHGGDDQLVAIDGSRAGVDRVKGADFEAIEYPGARHEIFNETNQDEVLADVTDFINRVLG